MAAGLALLALSSLPLVALQAVPRPGAAVLVLFSGADADAALLRVLTAPGWDPVRAGRIGPFGFVFAAPGQSGAEPAALWRDSGAALVLAAPGIGACAGRLT